MTPEPKDKLDAIPAPVGVVSRPEDANLDWRQIDWRQVEQNVRRLRQRIFTASKAGDLPRVVLTPEAKLELVDRIQHATDAFKALPVRRVYIPKPGGKQRPLGIPVILDRAHQARVVNALEPEWEARFEPRSYGFRPGRGCHDAIEAIFQVAKGKSARRRWVLDADLAGAFDQIAHDHILTMLGTFPARGIVRQWLKAGVVENGRLTRTEEGTPQGGVVTAPTQSQTSSLSGRFRGRGEGVGHEAWYSSV
jgi:RNA-directed DNA polymerase